MRDGPSTDASPSHRSSSECSPITAATREAARFIAVHADADIALGDVADHVGYSPFHLARSFERELGVPPGQFIAAQRFDLAKRLLLEGNDRIIDVCSEVGYGSLGTFTRRFASTVGTTPAEFRRLPLTLEPPSPPVTKTGGFPAGGVVSGTVRLSLPAAAALGARAHVYVGLFRRRVPFGKPVSGALVWGPGDFTLPGIAPGRYWVLASALPAGDSMQQMLLPAHRVVGDSRRALTVAPGLVTRCEILLDTAAAWSTPVVVALPPLASCPASLLPR